MPEPGTAAATLQPSVQLASAQLCLTTCSGCPGSRCRRRSQPGTGTCSARRTCQRNVCRGATSGKPQETPGDTTCGQQFRALAHDASKMLNLQDSASPVVVRAVVAVLAAAAGTVLARGHSAAAASHQTLAAVVVCTPLVVLALIGVLVLAAQRTRAVHREGGSQLLCLCKVPRPVGRPRWAANDSPFPLLHSLAPPSPAAHQQAQFWPGVTVPQLPPTTGVHWLA